MTEEQKAFLATLSPEDKAAMGIGVQQDRDEYAESVVNQAMKTWQTQYGPIVGAIAHQTAMDKLTKGLSPRAQEILTEKFKEKPADHILALANDETYSTLFRNGAESDASKEAAQAEADKVAAGADAGDGKKTATTTEVQNFQNEMRQRMGVEFTDDEARQAIKEANESRDGVV